MLSFGQDMGKVKVTNSFYAYCRTV